MSELEKKCGLICAYNEEKTIYNVVIGTKNHVIPVIVVDDGSTDKTAEKARNAGAIVLQHKRNLGKGAALKTGFEYFLSNDYDAVVTLDADGQHLPNEISLLINKFREGYDAVIAKRDFRSKSVPFLRAIGNLIFSYILSKLNKADMPDPENGFRIFNRNAISRFYNGVDSNGFLYEPSLIIKLIKNEFKVGWVDVSTVYNPKRESKIKPFKHVYESSKLCIRCLFGKI